MRAAVRFALLATLAGTVFVILAGLWVSGCPTASVATAACGRPERFALASGGPVIFLIAGVWAFVRTYQVWRREGIWWGWHGAGWFLLTLMVVALSMGFAPIAGLLAGPVLER